MQAIVVFLGPAGSGKSSLVGAYSAWLEERELGKVHKVNLDPAAEYIPYKPDFDIRKYVNAREVAVKFGLGPNGALVKSIEMITERISNIVDEIVTVDKEYILIDTPGQMEVFVFRDMAPKLFSELKRVTNRIVALFVVDASLITDPADYAFLALMSVAIQLRLDVDTVPVLNKVDLAPSSEVMGDVLSDLPLVVEKVRERGTYGEMIGRIMEIVSEYSKAIYIPRVSAKTMEGIEELHRIVHEVTCSCGDLS